ncbi:NUDIX hydrolase [Streptomyces sp. DT24]|uniref:NUDIX hydrolase n=1 Tax=Streptomyces sp. DT24 TaxID=3416520 RepID=UPI003CE755A9
MPHSVAGELSFLQSYEPRDYPPVAVTVDIVVLTVVGGRLCVLLVRRGEPPYEGSWALPGGFLRVGSGVGEDQGEDLHEAAARELMEETGLLVPGSPTPAARQSVYLEQLATYGRPGRDPRMRVVTVAYVALARHVTGVRASSDAREADWVPVADLALSGGDNGSGASSGNGGSGGSGERGAGEPAGAGPVRLAFDHARIAADAVARVRSKMQYTPIALALVDDEFTLGELQEVYEIVHDEPLHAANFRRKVTATPGFVESVGVSAPRSNPRGGPRNQKLYRAGPARQFHPGFLGSADGRDAG